MFRYTIDCEGWAKFTKGDRVEVLIDGQEWRYKAPGRARALVTLVMDHEVWLDVGGRSLPFSPLRDSKTGAPVWRAWS